MLKATSIIKVLNESNKMLSAALGIQVYFLSRFQISRLEARLNHYCHLIFTISLLFSM